MPRKILILGAGVYQVPLIKAARSLQLESHVVSIPGNYPGFDLADFSHEIDTRDQERILALASKLEIDAVCTCGTDVAMTSLGRLVDELGLSGPGFDSCQAATNKMLMKQAFVAGSVRSAAHRKIFRDSPEYPVEGLSWPLICKAVDLSGSRGIVKVESAGQLPSAVTEVFNETRLDYCIIEEFISGEEFGAQAFVQDGQLEMFMPHGDTVFVGKAGVPIGHHVPLESGIFDLADAKEQLSRAIRSLGIRNAPVNADFIFTRGKTFVLEIGARAGATGLAELVSSHYDINYHEWIVRAALGEKLTFPPANSRACVAELLTSDDSGELIELSTCGNPPDHVDIEFDYKVGDSVRKFEVGNDRIGQIVASGSTLDSARARLAEMRRKLVIRVNPGQAKESSPEGYLLCDLDGTLIRENIEMMMLHWLRVNGRLRLRDYILGAVFTPLNLLLAWLERPTLVKVWTAGRSRQELQGLLDGFFDEHFENIHVRESVVELLESFTGQRILLTACLEPLAQEWLKTSRMAKHIDRLVGARTGRRGFLLERHPYGKGKSTIARKLAKPLTGIGNDFADRHFLKNCRNGMIVAGDSRLEKAALKYNWTII